MLWAETLPQRGQVNADVVQRVQVNIAHESLNKSTVVHLDHKSPTLRLTQRWNSTLFLLVMT